jgi:hypothetical protein
MRASVISRVAAGGVLAAVTVTAPALLTPPASAASESGISVSMAGSALSGLNTGTVGCRQTARATVRNPDGSPVSQGSVDFFSHLSGLSGNLVATAPISNGTASVAWAPDRAGEHVISAIYYNDGAGVQPVAGSTMITVLPFPGACL